MADYFKPVVFNSRTAQEKKFIETVQKAYRHKTADLSGFVSDPSIGGSTANVNITVPNIYIPDFASPDRLFYPIDLRVAIGYWRYFYKLDPIIGNVIDMYAELLQSDLQLTGPGVEGSVKEAYERMLDKTRFVQIFKWFVIAWLVDGEVIPSLVWDKNEGIFSYIGFLDPRDLKVIDIPWIAGNPYMELEISEEVSRILKDPMIGKKFRDNVPSEVMRSIYQGHGVPIDTDKEVCFIPRKISQFDTRGTSICSRLWRVLMLEDADFNATIQTARRHAAPVKVLKMGNPATGWVPTPDQVNETLKMLAMAETDPHAWLVMHSFVNFEAWGTTDRAINISREYDTIERLKLQALGVSKAFLTGEVTYASAEKGLQVFLSRLKSLRVFFEQSWIYPRFFKQLAEKNNYIRPTTAEISHAVRTNRSRGVVDSRYIVPTIIWERGLEPTINIDLLRVVGELRKLNIPISNQTILGLINMNFKDELQMTKEEQEFVKENTNEIEDAEGNLVPDQSKGLNNYKPDLSDQYEKKDPLDKYKPNVSGGQVRSLYITSSIWDEKGNRGNWNYKDVEGLVELIKVGDTKDEFWRKLKYKGVNKRKNGFEYVVKAPTKISKSGYVVVSSDLDKKIGDLIKWDYDGKTYRSKIVDKIQVYTEDEIVNKKYDWITIVDYLKSYNISEVDLDQLKYILELEGIDCSVKREPLVMDEKGLALVPEKEK